jgi:COP9 signalosome complex subunit 5
MASTSTARARWELENNVQQQADSVDSYFKYDQAEQTAIQQQKPWSKDPHFFKQ